MGRFVEHVVVYLCSGTSAWTVDVYGVDRPVVDAPDIAAEAKRGRACRSQKHHNLIGQDRGVLEYVGRDP